MSGSKNKKIKLDQEEVLGSEQETGESESEMSEQESSEDEQEVQEVNEDVAPDNALKALFLEYCVDNNTNDMGALLQHPHFSEEIINSRFENGVTGFALACGLGNLGVVKLLLSDSRVGVNIQDDEGRTALFSSIISGQFEVTKELMLDQRVDIFLGVGEDALFTDVITMVFDGLENTDIFKLFLNSPVIDLGNQIGFENISIDLQTESKKMNITFNPTAPDPQELEQNPQQPSFTVSLDLGVGADLKPTEAGFLLNIVNRNYLKQNCQISVDEVVLTQEQKNNFFNRRIFGDLFKEFLGDKAAENLVPPVLLGDDFLRLKNPLNPEEKNARRYFRILQRLPLEMQGTVSQTKASMEEEILKETTGVVKRASFEKAVKKFLRDLNGQGGQQH